MAYSIGKCNSNTTNHYKIIDDTSDRVHRTPIRPRLSKGKLVSKPRQILETAIFNETWLVRHDWICCDAALCDWYDFDNRQNILRSYTQLYSGPERALLDLRKLHREIAYNVMAAAIPGRSSTSADKKEASASSTAAGALQASAVTEGAETRNREQKCPQLSRDPTTLTNWSTTSHHIQSTRILASLPTTEKKPE